MGKHEKKDYYKGGVKPPLEQTEKNREDRGVLEIQDHRPGEKDGSWAGTQQNVAPSNDPVSHRG